MEWYQWFSVFGGSTLVALIITFVWNHMINGAKAKAARKKEIEDAVSKELAAIKKGMQAMLRDRLYQIYDECEERGYVTIEERENFENLYEQYHTLGANGVMDSIYSKFSKFDLKV